MFGFGLILMHLAEYIGRKKSTEKKGNNTNIQKTEVGRPANV
jgi:hypothetical protein